MKILTGFQQYYCKLVFLNIRFSIHLHSRNPVHFQLAHDRENYKRML